MLTRQIEIDGKRYGLGEALAGAVEEVQERLQAAGASEADKVAAMREFIAHVSRRGGGTLEASELPRQFTQTEIAFLFRHAIEISGLRALPEGEVLRP